MSDKLSNSYRTNYYHNSIILQIDIHCQTVSDSVRQAVKQLQNKLLSYYIILQIDIHCQTVSDSVRQAVKTVTEKVYHTIC